RSATVINQGFAPQHIRVTLPEKENTTGKNIDATKKIIDIKGIMVKYCGILRNGPSLMYGISRVAGMLDELADATLCTQKEMEYYNMAQLSLEIFRRAYARKKSVGAHYRIDEGRYIDD
ncbi:MAG: hypothetical protein PHO15_08180, partial [Eubacteriales bacterium]|nr:hypothetical protein [Eubacteriales bacterium]